MSNIIGESISRLTEFSGAEVKRFNYPSDIGLTVAKAVWGVRKMQVNPEDIHALGLAYREGNTAYEEGGHLKIEIEEINKKLYEKSDEALNNIYQKGKATSLRHLLEISRMLGTEKFDFEFFESESGPLGLEIVLQHIDDGIFEKSDGAIIFNGEKVGLHTEVFVNSKGLPTYGAKDIGVISYKREVFPFDLSVIETGSEQNHYFDVVFSSNVLEHIKYIHTFQDEIQRVLKPEGIAIHILPTSSWRIWTSISYYFFMLKITLIIMIKLLKRSEDINPIGETTHAITKTKYILNAFFPPRHGERGNVITEIYYFSKKSWESLFVDTWWELQNIYPCRLFYTGYCVFDKWPGLHIRKLLSYILGSSCMIYIMKINS